LLANFKEGLNLLDSHYSHITPFAIDQYWKNLQKKDNWYMLKPLTVIQQPNFSDIAKGEADYTTFMT
jgi:tyrosyl-tRNA synthetase